MYLFKKNYIKFDVKHFEQHFMYETCNTNKVYYLLPVLLLLIQYLVLYTPPYYLYCVVFFSIYSTFGQNVERSVELLCKNVLRVKYWNPRKRKEGAAM